MIFTIIINQYCSTSFIVVTPCGTLLEVPLELVVTSAMNACGMTGAAVAKDSDSDAIANMWCSVRVLQGVKRGARG